MENDNISKIKQTAILVWILPAISFHNRLSDADGATRIGCKVDKSFIYFTCENQTVS